MYNLHYMPQQCYLCLGMGYTLLRLRTKRMNQHHILFRALSLRHKVLDSNVLQRILPILHLALLKNQVSMFVVLAYHMHRNIVHHFYQNIPVTYIPCDHAK